jgi:hypothetical protein
MRLRGDGLLSRAIGGEVMVLDLESSRYVTVNGSGALLYELLRTEDRGRDELVRALLDEFDVDEAQAAQDVDAFIAQLEDAGLLEGSHA